MAHRFSTAFAGGLLSGMRASRRLRVPFGVEREVVGAREAALAVAAAEGFRARVFAVMPGQLVRAGETPFATVPRTFVGFFAWNC